MTGRQCREYGYVQEQEESDYISLHLAFRANHVVVDFAPPSSSTSNTTSMTMKKMCGILLIVSDWREKCTIHSKLPMGRDSVNGV